MGLAQAAIVALFAVSAQVQKLHTSYAVDFVEFFRLGPVFAFLRAWVCPARAMRDHAVMVASSRVRWDQVARSRVRHAGVRAARDTRVGRRAREGAAGGPFGIVPNSGLSEFRGVLGYGPGH